MCRYRAASIRHQRASVFRPREPGPLILRPMRMRSVAALVLTAIALAGCASARTQGANQTSSRAAEASSNGDGFSVTTLTASETFEHGATRLDPVPRSFSPKITAAEAFDAVRGWGGGDAATGGKVFLALWTRYSDAPAAPSRRPVWVIHFADVRVAFSTSQTPSDESSLTRQVDVYGYVDAVSGTSYQVDEGMTADSPAMSWAPLPSPAPK